MGVVDELWRLPGWTQSPGEELVNTISHGIGLVAALIATPVLLLAAREAGSDAPLLCSCRIPDTIRFNSKNFAVTQVIGR